MNKQKEQLLKKLISKQRRRHQFKSLSGLTELREGTVIQVMGATSVSPLFLSSEILTGCTEFALEIQEMKKKRKPYLGRD